jgi:hypothetical protein
MGTDGLWELLESQVRVTVRVTVRVRLRLRVGFRDRVGVRATLTPNPSP